MVKNLSMWMETKPLVSWLHKLRGNRQANVLRCSCWGGVVVVVVVVGGKIICTWLVARVWQGNGLRLFVHEAWMFLWLPQNHNNNNNTNNTTTTITPTPITKTPEGFLLVTSLTSFKSSTPSFASWSRVTNLMVRSPKLFSWRLGVPFDRLERTDSSIVSSSMFQKPFFCTDLLTHRPVAWLTTNNDVYFHSAPPPVNNLQLEEGESCLLGFLNKRMLR